MTQELDALLARIDDTALRADLARHIDQVRAKRQFGLVFEGHMPETVQLPSHPVRRGTLVTRRAGDTTDAWVVERVASGQATIVAEGEEPATVPVSELVVLAEFGTPIYPGLKQVGSVRRGGDKPAHVVINGENHHALEALQFTHAGKVDCIYIDPPYNTGARDWKYNNDYVDKTDGWRHSKWLSFVERRLELAKQLLSPDGVLIVTIDEHEVHHLGMLLEQMFPGHRRPMITIVMNSAGNTQGGFYRVEEHAFFCFPPGRGPSMIPDDLLAPEDKKPRSLWGTHIRSGGVDDRPSKRPNMVYPVAIDPATDRFAGCGRSLEDRLSSGELGSITRADLDSWLPDPSETFNGHPVLWPFSKDGNLGRWRNDAGTLARLVDEGFVRVRRNGEAPGSNLWSVSYVTEGNRKKVADGLIPVLGRDDRDGSLILGTDRRPVIPKTVWKRRLHDATNWGSPILSAFIGANSFNYPKSPYAVRDTIATVVADRPDAVVLDFFAGSGTTLQALCMLNAADGGRRRTILVTNNEVGEAEAARLVKDGVAPGGTRWEERGIFEMVTRPRCSAVISGVRPDGSPVEGEYDDGTAYAEGFQETVEFFNLTYQDEQHVGLNMAFEAVAPLLWMRAGSEGPIVDRRTDDQGEALPFALGVNYGVLFDPDQWRPFVDGLSEEVSTVFVVTDSTTVFSAVSAELPAGVEPVRLYQNYLSTFEINRGGQ